MVERNQQILMILRTQNPWKNHWDVPGGFCNAAEHPMSAAERELAEETGLIGTAVAYVGTWMDVYGPLAPDGVLATTANAAYVVRLDDPRADVQLDHDEALEAAWWSIDALPTNLAFPNHASAMLATAAVVARELGAMPTLLDRPSTDGF